MAFDRAGGNTPGKRAVAAPVGLEGVLPRDAVHVMARSWRGGMDSEGGIRWGKWKQFPHLVGSGGVRGRFDTESHTVVHVSIVVMFSSVGLGWDVELFAIFED